MQIQAMDALCVALDCRPVIYQHHLRNRPLDRLGFRSFQAGNTASNRFEQEGSTEVVWTELGQTGTCLLTEKAFPLQPLGWKPAPWTLEGLPFC